MNFYLDQNGKIHFYTHLVKDKQTGTILKYCVNRKQASYVQRNCVVETVIESLPVIEVPEHKRFTSYAEAELYIKDPALAEQISNETEFDRLQIDMTERELENIEQGQAITELELSILGGGTSV